MNKQIAAVWVFVLPFVMLAVFGGSLVISAYRMGRDDERRRDSAESGAGAWVDGQHTALLRKLVTKMSIEGYVWQPAGSQDLVDPADTLPVGGPLEGNGAVFHVDRKAWRWAFCREGLKSEPLILLQGFPGPELKENFFDYTSDEWERFDSHLPAGSPTFRRLGTYAWKIYEEDHCGRAEAPSEPLGTATIDIRRKFGPQKYLLTVSDDCRPYRASVTITEEDRPHAVHVQFRLAQKR